MVELTHSKEPKLKERPSSDQDNQGNQFRKIGPKFELRMPDMRSIVEVSGTTPLDGIMKKGEKIEEGIYRIRTRNGKDAILHLKTGEDGRAYISTIELDGKKYENIQFYIDGGFARSKDGVFLGLDQIAIEKGKLIIVLQDDSKFLGIKEDIVVESGKLYDPDRKKISFLSHGDGEAPETNDKMYNNFDLWYGEGMKNDKLAADKEILMEQFRYLGELKVDTTIRLQRIESEQREVVILKKERESENGLKKEKISSIGIYREGGKTSGEGILLVNYSEYDGVNKREVYTRFDAIKISEEESAIIRCIMDPAFRKLYGRMYGFGEFEEIEGSNPRVQKIKVDAPVENVVQFRIPEETGESAKIEIKSGVISGEGEVIFFKPTAELEKNKFEHTEEKRTGETDTWNSKKEYGDTKEEPKKNSGKVINFESEKEKRREKSKEGKEKAGNKKKMDKPKEEEFKNKFETKKEKSAKKKAPKEEEKKEGKKREGKKEEPKKKEPPKFGQGTEKTRTERVVERMMARCSAQLQRTFEIPKQLFAKVEQFLSKELKLSKEKVQKIVGQFKIALQRVESGIKQEVKQLAVFVKELFKFEKIKNYLKNKIENNFVLNYTKIKLQKIMIRVEQKVEKLKVQVKESIENIKIKISNALERTKTAVKRMVEPIKPIIPIQKYEAIRKRIAHLILVYLILRVFSIGKKENKNK